MSLFTIRHIHVSDPEIVRRLGRIEQALTQLIKNTGAIMADFSGLEAELTGINDAATALEVLIQRIVDELNSGDVTDQAKITEFAGKLAALKSRLVNAALIGTPAEPV